MHTIVVGLNHKTANVEIREKCCFVFEQISEAFEALRVHPSILGAVILSTCNRVEIYASTNNIEHGYKSIIEFMSKYHDISADELKPFLYQKHCEQAVMHLFKVASGIDSMVLGEYQIQGQLRDAYHAAYSLNFTDSFLNKLFQSAINTGKRVRSETAIGKGRLSISHLAIEMIQQIFPHNNISKALIIGAGKMAKLMAKNLSETYVCEIEISNRSIDNAQKLALESEYKTLPYESRYDAMRQVEVIIVSTSAREYTVEYNEVKQMMEQHNGKVKLFIDLSIPRNIDPHINDIDDCLVYSIDDINKLIDININQRNNEVEKAESILAEVSEDFYNWYYKQILMPTMHEFRGKLEELKQQTLASQKTALDNMSLDHMQLTNTILDVYSDKLIRLIMKNLSSAISKDDLVGIIDSLKRITG